jgi:two-component system sensor histidine kinase/response regulator
VDAVKAVSYHAVLMDIQMPVMDGYTASKTIRQDKRFDDMPIIAMTANAMAGDREKALEAGMNDHVAKPIDPTQLFESLARWIKPGVRGFAPQATGQEPGSSGQELDTALPESVEGIEISEGLNRVGGNQKLYRKLLIKLREDYASAQDEIAAMLAQGNYEEAERAAHSIKGVAGNVGANQLQKAGTQLETAIKNRQEDILPETLDFFGQELAVVVKSLGVLGAEDQAAPAAVAGGRVATNQELAGALQKMLPYIKSKKPKPSKEALLAASQLNWPPEFGIDFAEIGRLIKKYKFKDALPLAEDLLERLGG